MFQRIKPADTIKPGCASLKLTLNEFQVWAAKATGWVQEYNFILAEVNVQHLYLNAILDKEVQQTVEALPEYAAANSFEIIKLVERVHNAANPLFVKRSNFYATHRGSGETGSVYIVRVKVLADPANISDMDQMEHVKFKVLRDLPVKVREKVLRQQDMTLEAMTTLVAKSEAMEIINASLKPEQLKFPTGRGTKQKEDAMPAVEKPSKKRDAEKKEKPRRKLPDEAYQMGFWVCGGQHRRDSCDADKSNMICELCGKEKNHVTAVCCLQTALRQDSPAAGQPLLAYRPGWWRWSQRSGCMPKLPRLQL